MNTRMYRLPIGVDCSSNQGKVRISGPCGIVIFNSSSKLSRKGNILIFLPDLTQYHSSIFTQAVLGVILGYTIELNLKAVVNTVGGLLASRRVFCWLPFVFFCS